MVVELVPSSRYRGSLRLVSLRRTLSAELCLNGSEDSWNLEGSKRNSLANSSIEER